MYILTQGEYHKKDQKGFIAIILFVIYVIQVIIKKIKIVLYQHES